MDTVCNKPLPLKELESWSATHYALFKSTLPTGVTNAIMISTAGHPVFAAAIAKLPLYFSLTRLWSRLQPYCSIMMSSGPLFLSLVVKDYLLQQPLSASPMVQVTAPPELTPYIVDLESSSWHHADAKALKWLGNRPWTWFSLGAVVFVTVICLINTVLLKAIKVLQRRVPSIKNSIKPVKLA